MLQYLKRINSLLRNVCIQFQNPNAQLIWFWTEMGSTMESYHYKWMQKWLTYALCTCCVYIIYCKIQSLSHKYICKTFIWTNQIQQAKWNATGSISGSISVDSKSKIAFHSNVIQSQCFQLWTNHSISNRIEEFVWFESLIQHNKMKFCCHIPSSLPSIYIPYTVTADYWLSVVMALIKMHFPFSIW